jgi:hypothetical protein
MIQVSPVYIAGILTAAAGKNDAGRGEQFLSQKNNNLLLP